MRHPDRSPSATPAGERGLLLPLTRRRQTAPAARLHRTDGLTTALHGLSAGEDAPLVAAAAVLAIVATVLAALAQVLAALAGPA